MAAKLKRSRETEMLNVEWGKERGAQRERTVGVRPAFPLRSLKRRSGNLLHAVAGVCTNNAFFASGFLQRLLVCFSTLRLLQAFLKGFEVFFCLARESPPSAGRAAMPLLNDVSLKESKFLFPLRAWVSRRAGPAHSFSFTEFP